VGSGAGDGCLGCIAIAIPVSWSTWLSKGISDEAESGGGLLIAAIQLAIMISAEIGGMLLDHFSVATTFVGGAALLVLASLVVGGGGRISPR